MTAVDNDPYLLRRFVQAQGGVYAQVLSELKAGQKESHWMWFILPQFDGLGCSDKSRLYAIKSIAEAKAYLQHPVLGRRLVECGEALLELNGLTAFDVFGTPDDMKLQSCATLFAQVAGAASVFHSVLDKYFDGEPDQRTLRLLAAASQVSQ